MKKIVFKIITIFLVVFCAQILVMLSTKDVFAQTLSLSIWPPLLEVNTPPGETIDQAYKLTNNSDQQVEVVPQIFPFEPVGNSGEIRLITQGDEVLNETSFFSFASGEEINKAFPLNVGESKDLMLQISVPNQTLEKDYYFTLLFSTVPPQVSQDKTMIISQAEIGTNILLTVTKNSTPPLLGRVIKFSAPSIVDSFSRVNFEATLENWGKNFWKPFGKIKIESILNQDSEVKLLEQNILSNSQRDLTLNSFKPRLPLGPFKARMEFYLNEGGKIPDNQGSQLSSSIVFWYVPYKLLAVLLALLLIISSIKKISKKIKKTPPAKQNPLKTS